MSSPILYGGNHLACSRATCFKIKPKGKVIHFVLMLKSQEQSHWVTKYFGHAFAYRWCEIQRWISWANRLIFQDSACSHPLKHGVTQSLTAVSLVASLAFLGFVYLLALFPILVTLIILELFLWVFQQQQGCWKFPHVLGFSHQDKVFKVI